MNIRFEIERSTIIGLIRVLIAIAAIIAIWNKDGATALQIIVGGELCKGVFDASTTDKKYPDDDQPAD